MCDERFNIAFADEDASSKGKLVSDSDMIFETVSWDSEFNMGMEPAMSMVRMMRVESHLSYGIDSLEFGGECPPL